MQTRATHRVTIIEVAEAAGVSRQTVSNVVNAPHKVASDTRARVEAEISRLGFRPNQAARSLKQERANAWGLEINARGAGRLGSIVDEFLVEITARSSRHGTFVVPFTAADPASPLPAYEAVLASRLADSFILTDTRRGDPRPPWLRARGINFAAFGRIWDDPQETRWVDVDGGAGTEAAVHHLAERGYQRIGYLGWPHGSPVGDDRRAGWARALTSLGLPGAQWQATTEQELEEATAVARRLIADIGVGGGIVCASDTLALGVWRACMELRLQPGPELGIVGFDDSDTARVLGITSLRQPLTPVAERVLEILNSPNVPPQGYLLTPSLVPRMSTSPTGGELDGGGPSGAAQSPAAPTPDPRPTSFARPPHLSDTPQIAKEKK